MYTYACIHIHMHMYMCVYTSATRSTILLAPYMYDHIYTYIHMYLHVHVHIHTCTSAHVYVRAYQRDTVSYFASAIHVWAYVYIHIGVSTYTCIPPALNHVKIFKGWPPRYAPSELVQLWYKIFPPDHIDQVGMKTQLGWAIKPVPHNLVRRIRFWRIKS